MRFAFAKRLSSSAHRGLSEIMTKALPYTAAGVSRRIRGIQDAGLHPIGVTADGTVLIGEKPLDSASLVPIHEHDVAASKWEDQRG